MITGIVVALPEELRTLTSKKLKKGCSAFLTDNIAVALAGVGPDNAKQAAESLIENGAERLVSWGCAAALDERLKPGDLTLPEHLIGENFETIEIRSSWLADCQNRLETLKPLTHIALAESSTLISTVEQKRYYHERTGAAVLDMESIAIARVAQTHRMDCLVVRAVADHARMNLPKAITQALDRQGEVVLSKLFAYLFKNPSDLAGLIQLGLHFHASQKNLKKAAAVWLTAHSN